MPRVFRVGVATASAGRHEERGGGGGTSVCYPRRPHLRPRQVSGGRAAAIVVWIVPNGGRLRVLKIGIGVEPRQACARGATVVLRVGHAAAAAAAVLRVFIYLMIRCVMACPLRGVY